MTLYPRAENRLWPWGVLLLRVVVGLVFFMHGWQKLFGEGGLAGVTGFFGFLGIPAPGFFALVVALLETVGGIAIILGVLTRLIGLLLAVDMLVALLLVHAPNGFFMSNDSPMHGIELVLLLGAAALALALTGPGALALDHALPLERRLSGRDAALAPGRG